MSEMRRQEKSDRPIHGSGRKTACREKRYVDNPLRAAARGLTLPAQMNELLLELDHVCVRRELLNILRAEFEVGGMFSGRLAIGEITAAPEMVYFLWHESGEPPVSMLIRRESLSAEDTARNAAQDFLAKWRKRLG